jgi:hypothetical protein
MLDASLCALGIGVIVVGSVALGAFQGYSNIRERISKVLHPLKKDRVRTFETPSLREVRLQESGNSSRKML